MDFISKRDFSASPVVPVMVIKQIEDAVPMAQALLEGGIRVFEITLRTDVALETLSESAKLSRSDCRSGYGYQYRTV